MSKVTKEMLKKIISSQELIMKHLKINGDVAEKAAPKKITAKKTTKSALPKKNSGKKS